MQQRTDQMSVSPSAIARVLGAIAFLLVLASIGGQIAKYWFGYNYLKGAVALFHVDAERNIPTFFSVSLMLCAALLLAVIAVLSGKRGGPDMSKWTILIVWVYGHGL